MASNTLKTPRIILTILLSFLVSSGMGHALRRMGVTNPDGEPMNTSNDFQTFYYEQTLDHFNYKPESYATFKQKYLVNDKHWGGAVNMAPIFVYLGAEQPLTASPTLLTDIAGQFSALLLYIEHRFYGESIPFGLTMEEVMENASVRGYFSSAQALADYAEVIIHVKESFNATHTPVIVFGGSYGGMLASWFRLKYPHIALGALASSAPILYFDNITPEDGYYSVVTKDFQETSMACYQTIRDSWAVIDKVGSQPDGLSILHNKFKLCQKLNSTTELKTYLIDIYATAAQYGQPPVYTATAMCNAIDGSKSGDILSRIFAGVEAYYPTDMECYDPNASASSQTGFGWYWQTCSEMLMPIGFGPNSPMFQSAPYSLSNDINSCKSTYGVAPRPHWITTYYGGHDIKLVLQRYGSNIIFSNGLKDPFSSGGVLENISDTIVAITTKEGSHCMDIAEGNAKSDPQWLVEQRNKEVEIIKAWIKQYYTGINPAQSKKRM